MASSSCEQNLALPYHQRRNWQQNQLSLNQMGNHCLNHDVILPLFAILSISFPYLAGLTSQESTYEIFGLSFEITLAIYFASNKLSWCFLTLRSIAFG